MCLKGMMIKMFQLTEKEYKSKLKELEKINASKERKLKLKEEKGRYKRRLKTPSTSKIALFVVFAICIEILIYCQYAMIKTNDLSAMYALIGVPVSLVPMVIGYYWKSKNENTIGGIVYEKALLEQNSELKANCQEDGIMTDEETVG